MSETQFDLLELVERLESLREEMQELGVETLSEVEARIRQLHRRIDDLPDSDER